MCFISWFSLLVLLIVKKVASDIYFKAFGHILSTTIASIYFKLIIVAAATAASQPIYANLSDKYGMSEIIISVILYAFSTVLHHKRLKLKNKQLVCFISNWFSWSSVNLTNYDSWFFWLQQDIDYIYCYGATNIIMVSSISLLKVTWSFL